MPSPLPKSASGRLKQPTGNRPWHYSLVAAGFGGLGLVTTFLLLWWQLVLSANEEYAKARADNLQQAFVAVMNNRIDELRTQVRGLAASPQVVDALISYDPETLRATGELLTDLVAHARRIEIVPKGQASIDQNAAVPISFAALDVINRAEAQPFVGPESANLEGRGYIYAAAPVTHEGLVVGTLFVALAPAYFSQALNWFDTSVGSVSVRQTLDGGAATDVITWGEEDPSARSLDVALSNGSWSLAFKPGPVQQPIANMTHLLTAFGVALLTLFGGVALAQSALTRHLESDASTFTNFLQALARGRSAKLERYRLATFQTLATELPGHLSQKAQPAKAAEERQPEPGVAAQTAAAAKKSEPADAADNFLNAASSEANNFGIEVEEEPAPIGHSSQEELQIDRNIFRAYDIRGMVEENLTPEVVYWIGRAFATEAAARHQSRVAVGRDGRNSSEMLRDALTNGLTEGGLQVIDIGLVPTPLLYFATHDLDTGTGIMITGSHNPPEYNGLKMMIDGETLAEERISALYNRITSGDLSEGEGDRESVNLEDRYLDRILDDVAIAQSLKVVVDCGNGAAGVIAPRLLEELGCDVVPLYCDVDGNFPNHHPDPAEPANLDDLITVVKAESAQLGIAFDGDGDRLGVVTASGAIIWPDKLMMLFAQDVVGRNPGADIIYDVKCSRHLNTIISENGGRPIMWKTGHSHIKAKIRESGALLGGEFSGHICFGERWYGFDDALYAAARLIEILASESRDAEELFAQFPITHSTPEIKVSTSEEEKFQIIGRLARDADFGDGTLTEIDGVRVDYPDGWGLIRASNTSPVLTLRFEADGESALERIQDLFQDCLTAIDPALRFR